MKDKLVGVRLDDNAYNKLTAFASKEKITITEAMRHCVMHACRNVSPETKTADEYKAELITAVSGANAVVKSIMKRYASFGLEADTIADIWEGEKKAII